MINKMKTGMDDAGVLVLNIPIMPNLRVIL